MKNKILLTIVLIITLSFVGCNSGGEGGQSEQATACATERPSKAVTTPTEAPHTEGSTAEKSAKGSKSTTKIDKLTIKDSLIDIENTPSSGRYCYSRLNNKQKLYYEKIRRAIKSLKSTIYWNSREYSPDDMVDIDDILTYITYDYPEYFWYAKENCYAETIENKLFCRVNLNYEYTEDEVLELNKRLEPVIDAYLESSKGLTSDYEKSLNAYRYIINNTVYNQAIATAGYTTFSQMESKNIVACWDITGVFLNGDAICRGYTQAYQYLMNLQGIDCTYVYGDNHCWNLTKLDGDWYYTDVTWGDPLLELTNDFGETVYQEQGINYSCLNMTTEQLLQIHTPDPNFKLGLPTCTATKDNYLVRNGG